MRLRMLMGIVALVGCASNRSSDEPEARIRDSAMTARDTVEARDTSHGTREMPGDSVERRTLSVPGDSMRLEDTLSPPQSSVDTALQR